MPTHDVHARRIAWIGITVVLVVTFVVALSFLLLHLWRLDPGADRVQLPPQLPADAPQLQTAPQLELKRYRNEKQRARPAALLAPSPPQAALVQAAGAPLPLELPLLDSDGRTMRLADFFHPAQPVLLVPGYYRCPQLCGLLMHGLLDGLQASGLGPADVTIVGISIDPEDTPATARQRLNADLAYAQFLGSDRNGHPLPDLHLLVAKPAEIKLFTQRVGLRYSALPDDGPARFAHAAGVIVATPDGRISSYLPGVNFEPAQLRAAVAEAKGGRIGALSDRLALLCAHFDPRPGRLNGLIMNGLRALGLLMTIALAAWCWRRRGSGAGDA